MAFALASVASAVIGIDTSAAMLPKTGPENVAFYEINVRDLPEAWHGAFNVIVARMVFHHILTDADKAAGQCFRALKPGGRIVIAEAVPPNERSRFEYERIMSLKERRNNIQELELRALLGNAGFAEIKSRRHVMRGFSVRNWLDNNALDDFKKETIFKLHAEASSGFKRACRMRLTGNDCIIDSHHLILTARKR